VAITPPFLYHNQALYGFVIVEANVRFGVKMSGNGTIRKELGFSLIELLIVVAIILIIVAIAVPNLLRSRMAANEASAVQTLRTISSASTAYMSQYNIGYPGDLNYMGPPATPPPTSSAADLLDSTVSGGCPAACVSNTAQKSGYTFTYVPGPGTTPPSFTVVAVPTQPQNTGTSTFCIDQTGVLYRDIGNAGGLVSAIGTGCVADGWSGPSVGPL
jgi:type IV pilus assembly protein PilA